MNPYTLRSMDDGELEELCRRLERQVRKMGETTTALGRKLLDQYRGTLTAARLEQSRRACDE